jgi:hypothetical protein
MRHFQHGFSIFELIVVIAVTSLIGVWSATTWVYQSEDVASEAMGSWLMTVKESVDQMLVRQADFLTGLSSSVSASADYQDIWRPSLAELLRAGHLPSGFSLRAPLGYDVSIRILEPNGLCLTLGCKLEVLTVAIPQASQGLRAENVTRLGKLLASLKGSGASVSQLSPGRVRGPSIDLPNPPASELPSLPVGSIVLYSFYDSSAQASFLRQGEKRDVQLAANLSLAGSLTTGGSVSSDGDIRATGKISSRTGISATGRIASAAHLQTAAVEDQGSPCDAAGLLAQSSSGGLLVCQAGIWQSSTRSWGGFYIDRVGFGCDVRDEVSIDRSNPMTGDCSCPTGYRAQLVSVWTYPRHSYNEFYTYICLSAEG